MPTQEEYQQEIEKRKKIAEEACKKLGGGEDFPFPLSRYNIFCPQCNTELVEVKCPHCGKVSDKPIDMNEGEE